MNGKKDILRIILAVLITIFLLVGIGALLLAGYRKRELKEKQKQIVIEKLEKIPTSSPALTVTPTPTLKPAATPTPTPVPTVIPAFHPKDYMGEWYGTNEYVTIMVYDLSEKSVSFTFTQTDSEGAVASEADVLGEVSGNAAQFMFTDTLGNQAKGSMIFDDRGLFVKIETTGKAGNSSVYPAVNCMMSRECRFVYKEPAAEAAPTKAPAAGNPEDYFFPDSDSRYLTDEELSGYSSADLELAKNEIYARHGRQFVTKRIADYFNSKSWYHGTIAPEYFDQKEALTFNEYEVANIDKIVQWETKKRSEGN